MKTIFSSRGRYYAAKFSIFLILAALIAGMVGYGGSCEGYNPPPSQNLEIRDWYDLDSVRDNLAGNHTLMNNLNSTTPGYTELASPTADGGKGWDPIGIFSQGGGWRFTGTLDGQGHEICDLFINRPGPRTGIGLVGVLGKGGLVKNIGVVNVTVTGSDYVGGLVGCNYGNMSNCYATSNVTGEGQVGGLVGKNIGNVINCYATSNVTGEGQVGGLVGLVGKSRTESAGPGTVSNSYSTGNVTGVEEDVGGLVGDIASGSTVSNSFWDTETSGQATSDGGTGKNTTEMKNITTFSGVGWNIITVANTTMRDPSYTWNIVNNVTYPFLSWEPVS